MKLGLSLFFILVLTIFSAILWLRLRTLSEMETHQMAVRQCLDSHMQTHNRIPSQDAENYVTDLLKNECAVQYKAFLDAVYETQREKHGDILDNQEAMSELRHEFTQKFVVIMSEKYK